VHDLPPDRRVTLGRNRGNTIVLQDKHASRWHAEILPRDGRWFIADCGTLNGTKVNGQRIHQPTPLADGHEIAIGDTRLRVLLDPSNGTPEPTTPPAPAEAEPPAAPPAELSSTLLQADELTVLCGFMSASVGLPSSQELIVRALATVHTQTRASVVGFLSLDPDDPIPKVVLPELARVDIHLSRHLTQKVQREGRTIWLGANAGEAGESDSLLSFHDAVCVPLGNGDAPLGALHVYKAGKGFTEREVRFCEVLCGFLASSLQVLRQRRQLEAENERLRLRAAEAGEMVGDSPPMQQLRHHLARVAPRDCTVLIQGESGSGKELVALALHRLSRRMDGPLVTVNCAAISPSLAEAELFGHARAGFTGAERDRAGFFRQADEGTLFLDEIGELSLEIQAKLLRAIETKKFRPVAAEAEEQADVRIVAATHRDLGQMVRQGRFRQDLFFRLGIPIKVPPLRDHAEDIPALVNHFLPRLCQEYRRKVRLTRAALERLRNHAWPGNVRQLRMVLEHAVAMAEADVIDAGDLFLEPEAAAGWDGPPSLDLEAVEAWAVRKALRREGGNKAAAARALGIHRDTLAAKLAKYGIRDEEG
ncbi:MAG TPA: sigma 54-interacting transcriptional regulator, partial [Gemmataceae bacterium]|nr:sigma 54-interacting transcriptional regulator [Gemmataceae bacterium]